MVEDDLLLEIISDPSTVGSGSMAELVEPILEADSLDSLGSLSQLEASLPFAPRCRTVSTAPTWCIGLSSSAKACPRRRHPNSVAHALSVPFPSLTGGQEPHPLGTRTARGGIFGDLGISGSV